MKTESSTIHSLDFQYEYIEPEDERNRTNDIQKTCGNRSAESYPTICIGTQKCNENGLR